MLSILYVKLTIKVKVGIQENFKVGWYPPPPHKKKKTGSSHLNYILDQTMLNVQIHRSRIPLNKGTNSRLRVTTYTDLYDIAHPSIDHVSLGPFIRGNLRRV